MSPCIHQDVLKADFNALAEQCGGPLKIMANLPYSISNPFLFKLIDNHEQMDWATIMLQKEVAERLMAQPGTKDYGVPTVLLQSCATVRPLMTLKPGEFHPRPKIDSVVVRIDFSPTAERVKQLPEYDHKIFRHIVRAAFNQRRKTLLNTLTRAELFTSLPMIGKAEERELTGRTIEAAGILPGIRAEELVLEDFVRLTVEASRQIESHAISGDRRERPRCLIPSFVTQPLSVRITPCSDPRRSHLSGGPRPGNDPPP